MEVMNTPSSRTRRFLVTVTHLPVTRCQICHRTVAYQPGNLSEGLTEHYGQAHPEVLAVPSPLASRPARAICHAPAGICPARDDLAAMLGQTVPAVTQRGQSTPRASA
jgi:hypothetical protein